MTRTGYHLPDRVRVEWTRTESAYTATVSGQPVTINRLPCPRPGEPRYALFISDAYADSWFTLRSAQDKAVELALYLAARHTIRT